MNAEHYMKLALAEAQKAFEKDEVPIGAVLVQNNQILSRTHNQVEMLHDATAHAEILALTSAFDSIGSKYLPDATLYVTIEPCLMCAGALHWSKIGNIVYGASDEKNGALSYCHKSPFHPKTNIQNGILQDECAQLMKNFFQKKRSQKL